MNFASVKSLTIPEGAVKKITDPSGAVLWEKAAGIYGVEWSYASSYVYLTRLEDAAGFANPKPAASVDAVGSSPFDDIMPWAGMKKYNIIDGAVAYSEDDEGFDMTAYDTMVYIPPFYYKAEKDETNSKWRWYISPGEQEGFALHPGSGRYVGRYHTSEAYTSVSGVVPITSITCDTARINSHAKGDKWWQLDFATWCALELLYLVEFATWNSQTVLNTTNGAGEEKTPVAEGLMDSAKYHTVKTVTNGDETNQYRNIENLFTNVSTLCDGYVTTRTYSSDGVTTYGIYVGLRNEFFSDGPKGLAETGLTPMDGAGDIRSFGFCKIYPWAFIPDRVYGTTGAAYVCDSTTKSRFPSVLIVGGHMPNKDVKFGMFYHDTGSVESDAWADTGSRLIFIP